MCITCAHTHMADFCHLYCVTENGAIHTAHCFQWQPGVLSTLEKTLKYRQNHRS